MSSLFFLHLFGFKKRSALRFEGVLMVRVALEWNGNGEGVLSVFAARQYWVLS